LREERRLRVFENRVLRRVFGTKMDEVTGECRKLHNEELNNLYSSPGIVRVVKSRRMRWAGHVARMGEERAKQLFCRNPPDLRNSDDFWKISKLRPLVLPVKHADEYEREEPVER
jgi:hypothetical protein